VLQINIVVYWSLGTHHELFSHWTPMSFSPFCTYWMNFIQKSQDGVFSIVSLVCAVPSRVWTPAETRDFILLQTVQTGSGAHPAFFTWVKAVRAWRWPLTWRKTTWFYSVWVKFCSVNEF